MYIDIERVDPPRSDWKASLLMGVMNQAAREELVEDANRLAYNYLKHSGAFRSLSGEQWDAMAEKMALRMLGLLDNMIETVERSGG